MAILNNAFCRVYQKTFKMVMPVFNWDEPELLKGPGAIKDLPALVKSKGITNVLIVTDKGLMSLNLLDSLFEALEKQGIKYTVYDGVQPNPSIENIEEGRRIYLKNDCQGIIAFGGGSPMDCAKVVGARIANPNKSVSQMRGLLKVVKKIPPFFAVPTTAGTGSETTIAALITDPETHHKYALMDLCLIPRYAILDAELTTGLPPFITATTGMDALTHAIEAYLCWTYNTKESLRFAEEATKLIFDNLEKAYEDGSNKEARQNMMIASFKAGFAFTRAGVGNVHAIAHTLGGLYNSAHGLANAVILPIVLEEYGSAVYEKLARLAEITGVKESGSEEEKAKAFIAEIYAMNKRMGIPEKFDFIKDEDIPQMTKWAYKETNPIYPVPVLFNEEKYAEVIGKIRG